jgi:hypothetical protein
MALRTPPSWLQNGSHPAENDRLSTQALYWAMLLVYAVQVIMRLLKIHQLACQFLLRLVGRQLLVQHKQTWVLILAYNDASLAATITTADPTNPRIDLVCITVNDSAYTGSLNNVVVNVVAGTPAVSPSVPATPANSIALARVAVAAGATTIITANITDVRTRTDIDEVVFSSSTTSTVPVRIQLNAGQTGNALQIVNSSGTVLNGFDSSGNLLTGGIDAASLEYEFIMGAY